MMKKSAQAGEVGGGGATTFHYIYHQVQSCGVRSSWEDKYTPPIYTLPLYVLNGADTFPLFLLYPYMFSVAYITNHTTPDIKLRKNIFYG